MEATQLEQLTILRSVIGYLGERDQYAWWQSSFFGPGRASFLAPVFGRTQLLAQCIGVTRAAALIHDERIGVGDVYHLFRLPEEFEQGIHRLLQASQFCARLAALTASKDAAQAHLRATAIMSGKPAAGPVLVSNATELPRPETLHALAAHYLHGFTNRTPAYPYFSGKTA